jgi:hypothetical protein
MDLTGSPGLKTTLAKRPSFTKGSKYEANVALFSSEASPTWTRTNDALNNKARRALSQIFAFKFGEKVTPIPTVLNFFWFKSMCSLFFYDESKNTVFLKSWKHILNIPL